MEITEIEMFADGILRKHHGNWMRAIQYLEHCIRVCDFNGNIERRDEFATVRDFIVKNHQE